MSLSGRSLQCALLLVGCSLASLSGRASAQEFESHRQLVVAAAEISADGTTLIV